MVIDKEFEAAIIRRLEELKRLPGAVNNGWLLIMLEAFAVELRRLPPKD